MKYVNLGKTGLKASKLGFGCMRLPYAGGKLDFTAGARLLETAFDNGVNYFDTAPLYCDNQSEELVGRFIQGRRGKVILATKNMGRTEADWSESFERSFRRLRTDYIDMFFAWSMDLAAFRAVAKNGVLELLYKAKKEGRVRHAAFSFHDDSPDNVKEVIDSGLFEAVLLSFNILRRENLRWLEYAKKKGLGTLIMNPVAGGNLSECAALALKYVYGHSFADVALSGMGGEKQVLENCAAADGEYALSDGEREKLFEAVNKLNPVLDLYCTGCGYCRDCPKGVDIPEIFRLYNNAVIAEFFGRDGDKFAASLAAKCTRCGACVGKCPQKLDIPKKLAQIALLKRP